MANKSQSEKDKELVIKLLLKACKLIDKLGGKDKPKPPNFKKQ